MGVYSCHSPHEASLLPEKCILQPSALSWNLSANRLTASEKAPPPPHRRFFTHRPCTTSSSSRLKFTPVSSPAATQAKHFPGDTRPGYPRHVKIRLALPWPGNFPSKHPAFLKFKNSPRRALPYQIPVVLPLPAAKHPSRRTDRTERRPQIPISDLK